MTLGADERVERLDLTFPEQTTFASSTVDSVTLEGLQRSDVTATLQVSGTTASITFEPPVAPSSNLVVRMFFVVTPPVGGTYPVTGSYLTTSGPRPLPALDFKTKTPTVWERVVRWMDTQAWVASLNNIQIVNLFFKPQLLVGAIPVLFKGWLLSIALVAVAFPMAIPGGLLFAFMKMAKVPPLRWISAAYINVIRGTPLFLQIYVAYLGLPLMGIRSIGFVTGTVVLALNSSAYLAEIFRAGIQSIHKGQFEAASSLGMTYRQAMQYVIIPQTVLRVLPTMTSEFILLFKDTALLAAMGVFELMKFSTNQAANAGNLTPYVVAAAYYLIITIPLIRWVGHLEARLAVAEGGQATVENPRKRAWWRLGLKPPASENASE
jgi:polar amino acid transport system substrate-binding protein